MKNLTYERLKDFERDPLNNFLTRSEMMEVVRENIAIRETQGVPVENLEHFIRFYGRVVLNELKPSKNEFEQTLWFLQSLPKVFTAPQLPVVPEGWQMVPVKPTQAMLDAAVIDCNGDFDGGYEVRKAAEELSASVYIAALAAAPKPGGE